VSTPALLRSPSRTIPGVKALVAVGNSIRRLAARRLRTGKDSRVLQTLPDHVLADIGLERIEFTSGTYGSRQTWVIPHRYY
jgi:uncharacterized protein YjiS (DUF1127 family)